MRKQLNIPIKDSFLLGDQICHWLANNHYGLVLRSNRYRYDNPLQDNLQRYELLAGLGVAELVSPNSTYFELLKDQIDKGDWLFGYLGYDLKNSIEKSLTSNNPDGLGFPVMMFYVPQVVFALTDNTLTIHYHTDYYSLKTVKDLYHKIINSPRAEKQRASSIQLIGRYQKQEYLDTIKKILQHIQRGDIYEMNLCQEFYASPCTINPYETYINLNGISPTPFSAFGRFNDNYLICASPERYIQKMGNMLVSQPIKGTIARSENHLANQRLMEILINDEKERAENIMIVDLVRNDLSRVAERASVKVEELCGVYTFQQVNQMISTVSCKLNSKKHPIDALIATFPMGSMTGAPKVRAMQLIEEYERSRRGLFSGAVGYFTPEGNFDFNVVIRTILYNAKAQYLSLTVGGAITANSIPEKEYEECLLKASAIGKVLGVM